MWDDFHEAFAHDRHVVLGRKLKPYCAYHLFWLKVIKSPLVTGGVITISDLEAASRICSCRYGEAGESIEPRAFEKLRFYWRAMRYRLDKEIEAFQRFADDFNSPPTPESEGGESTFKGEQLPHEIWIVSGLINMGFSPQEAWMTPLGEAEWYLSVGNLHNGKPSNILTGHDREFRAGLQALRERKKNGSK
jgi:hypothetical protein